MTVQRVERIFSTSPVASGEAGWGVKLSRFLDLDAGKTISISSSNEASGLLHTFVEILEATSDEGVRIKITSPPSVSVVKSGASLSDTNDINLAKGESLEFRRGPNHLIYYRLKNWGQGTDSSKRKVFVSTTSFAGHAKFD